MANSTRGGAATAPERQTRRQQKIAEQRGRIEELRRQQRRKRLTWLAGILIVAAILVGAAFLFIQPPAAAQGRQIPSEGRNHVDPGTPLTYQNRPPSSGTHFPSTAPYGVFDREIEPGYWIHNLEHGAIVVLYRPDLCDATCVQQLRDTYNAAPRSRYGNVKMTVLPYKDMDHMVAAVAWTWVDEMDQVDKDRILAFYRDHVDRGPEAVA